MAARRGAGVGSAFVSSVAAPSQRARRREPELTEQTEQERREGLVLATDVPFASPGVDAESDGAGRLSEEALILAGAS